MSTLFPHSKILEMEVLALCRRELRAMVYPTAQMLDDTVVAIQARISLALNYEVRIAILMFARSGYHHNALEV